MNPVAAAVQGNQQAAGAVVAAPNPDGDGDFLRNADRIRELLPTWLFPYVDTAMRINYHVYKAVGVPLYFVGCAVLIVGAIQFVVFLPGSLHAGYALRNLLIGGICYQFGRCMMLGKTPDLGIANIVWIFSGWVMPPAPRT